MEDDQNTFEKSKITKIEVWVFWIFKGIFDKLKILRVFQSFYRFQGNFGNFFLDMDKNCHPYFKGACLQEGIESNP